MLPVTRVRFGHNLVQLCRFVIRFVLVRCCLFCENQRAFPSKHHQSLRVFFAGCGLQLFRPLHFLLGGRRPAPLCVGHALAACIRKRTGVCVGAFVYVRVSVCVLAFVFLTVFLFHANAASTRYHSAHASHQCCVVQPVPRELPRHSQRRRNRALVGFAKTERVTHFLFAWCLSLAFAVIYFLVLVVFHVLSVVFVVVSRLVTAFLQSNADAHAWPRWQSVVGRVGALPENRFPSMNSCLVCLRCLVSFSRDMSFVALRFA